MSRSKSLEALEAGPTAILTVLGWGATAAILTVYSPILAGGTLAAGLVLWHFDLQVGALAVTQIAVGVLAPDAELGTIAVIEIGPILLVQAILAEQGLSPGTFIAWTGFTLLLGIAAIGGLVWGASLSAAVGTLIVTLGLSSYVLHRYRLVTLGLLDSEST